MSKQIIKTQVIDQGHWQVVCNCGWKSMVIIVTTGHLDKALDATKIESTGHKCPPKPKKEKKNGRAVSRKERA